jgi:moderate conductance mechanosensitive channel
VLLQISDDTVFSVHWLTDHGIRVALVVALAIVLSRLGTMAVRRFRRRIEGSPGLTLELSLQRSATLIGTLASVVRVVVWSVAMLMILGELGFDLGPLLAGAGVVGLALGFGAQSLVRDFLAGFFILLENQFGVGETVELSVVGGSVTGRVETLTLRSTSVRSVDGTLSTIPNGNIQFASNKSRGRGEVTVDVRVAAQEGPESLQRRVDELLDELHGDEGLRQRLSASPLSAEVEPTSEGQAIVKVAAETRPSRREEVEGEIRKRIQRRFLVASDD